MLVAVSDGELEGLYDAPRLGFEDWWTFDSTETGAGGQLRTNLATGNAVWSRTLLENPGRGLGTFMRLAYNSQEPVPDGEDPDGDGQQSDTVDELAEYDQAGAKVSVQLAGITRLNEPLLIRPTTGELLFVDGDGTRHRFPLRSGPATGPGREWTAPPGVHLRFRETADQDPQSQRAIVATRPDGTSYEFDRQGFLRRAVDRNGNALRASPTRSSTRSAMAPERRARRSEDAAASGCWPVASDAWTGSGTPRRSRIRPGATPEPGRSTTTPRGVWRRSATVAVRVRRPACATEQRRRTLLAYDEDRLASVREAVGSPAERITRLEYDTERTELTGIQTPTGVGEQADGRVTRATYADLPKTLLQQSLGLPADRTVATVTDRRQTVPAAAGDGDPGRPTTTSYAIAPHTGIDGFLHRDGHRRPRSRDRLPDGRSRSPDEG